MNMNLKGIMQTLGAKPGQVVSNPYVKAFAATPTIIEAEGETQEVSMESVNEDTKRVNILGIDFNISEMNGRIFFSFIDKKAASIKIREIGTNKIVNLIQNSLDKAYGKGEFFFKGGDHAEFQNGYLFQRSIGNIKLNKLKFESVINEASYTVKADNAYQFINGATAVLGVYLRDEKLESGVKSTLQRVVKDLEGLRKYFFSRKDESVNTESVNKSLRLPKLK